MGISIDTIHHRLSEIARVHFFVQMGYAVRMTITRHVPRPFYAKHRMKSHISPDMNTVAEEMDIASVMKERYWNQAFQRHVLAAVPWPDRRSEPMSLNHPRF